MDNKTIEEMAREYWMLQWIPPEWLEAEQIELLRDDISNAFTAGARAVLPKATTDVPTEPGLYLMKGPRDTRFGVLDLERTNNGGLMMGCWDLDDAEPGTQFARILPPQEAS